MKETALLAGPLASARRIAPGLALCALVTLVAVAADATEARLFGRAWLEALVLAILLGTTVRTLWTPALRFHAGVDFSAKTLLEIAVVLLGLSVSVAALVKAGPALIAGIAAIVMLAIAISYAIGRLAGLPHKLAVLIACGNSICGNSAIAATAPVIRADGDDVAASIAFTAVLGVLVVLALPLMVALAGLTKLQYGVFAGLTVYAVPQVIAATAPVGPLSVQIGTLVKLVRVLMLGPVILVLALANRRGDADTAATGVPKVGIPKVGPGRLVPWFILGFLAMIGLRATGIVPPAVLGPAAFAANLLTILAMAALGLSVDVRTVAKAGLRVTGVMVLSLVALGGISLALIHVLALS